MYNVLNNTCYLCLTPKPNLISFNQQNYNKIRYILPELVIFEPDVSQAVCCSCLETTTSFFVFKMKCLENNRRLMNLVTKQRQKEQQYQQQRQLEKQQQQQRHLEQQQTQQRQQKQQQRQLELQQQQQQQQQLEYQQEQHQQRQLEQQAQQRQQEQQQQQQQRQLELQQQQIEYQKEQQQQQQQQLEYHQEQQQQLQRQRQLEQHQQQQQMNNSHAVQFLNKLEKIDKIIEQGVNNEFNSNLQIQNSFSLAAGHKQTKSVVNSTVVPENITPTYSINIERYHEGQITDKLKDIETTSSENIFQNVKHTKNNSFQKDEETKRTPDGADISIQFCDRITNRQLTKEQTLEARTTENSNLLPAVQYGPTEVKEIFLDNIQVAENFNPFSGQLTKEQKYIETRRLEEIFENELTCAKTEIKNLEHNSQTHIKEEINNVKEIISPIHTEKLKNEQIDLEAKKLEAVNENQVPCFQLKNGDSVSSSAAKESNNIERNFDSFNNQQLSESQKDLKTKDAEESKQYLSSLKTEIVNSLSLPAEESSVEDANDAEQLSNEQTDFGNHEEIFQNNLPCSIKRDEQNDLEIKNLKKEKEYLSSFKVEIEDTVSLPARNSSIEDDNNVKYNSHEKDVGSNQEELLKNYLPSSQVNIEDSNSLYEEVEDTETNSSVDIDIKEEFVPYYSSDSKFYRELVNSLNSRTVIINSEVSASSIKDTLIYNFYNNFHINSLNNSETVTCPICAEKLVRTSMPSHLKMHVSNDHFEKCKCSICNEQLLIGMLPRHLEMHNNKKGKVNCPVCSKEMLKSSLPRHLKMHNNIKDHECNICNKKFLRASYLKDHFRIHNGPPKIAEKGSKFKCDICKRKYVSVIDFEKHKQMHAEDSDNWKFECEICNKKFYFKKGFNSHMLYHKSTKNFECTLCGKNFTYKNQLEIHEASVAHNKKIWECPVCDKKFTRQPNLIQHKKIHTGIKKFECKICNMKFLHNSHLKQHEYTHAGTKKKKFKCTVCKKAFMYNGSLKKHMESHPKTDDSE